MKIKDYFRLSKISLKSRKKNTSNTVRGISFGLIMLMPLLFIIIAFHVDLNKEVNKDSSIRVFDVDYVNNLYNDEYCRASLTQYKSEIDNIDGVEKYITYNQYYFDNIISYMNNDEFERTNMLSIILDNKEIELDYYIKNPTISEYNDSYNQNYIGFNVINQEESNSLFLTSDYDALGGKSPLIYGNEFSKNSKSEIMVSTNFLLHHNLNETDVLNKKISIQSLFNFSGNASSSKTEVSSESLMYYRGLPLTIVKDFTIVGVFDSNIYKTEPRINSENRKTFSNLDYETYFWITTDSMTKSSLPEVVSIEEGNDEYKYNMLLFYYAINPIDINKECINSNSAYFPLGMGAQTTYYDTHIEYNTLLEFESYKAANSAIPIINSFLVKSSTNQEAEASLEYLNYTFENYRMFYNIFTYISIGLAIFGGIVFLATLLNLYNTIHYSVQSRKNFLGMMRAIGMKTKEIKSLFFVEVLQVFLKSYIVSIIFGGLICGGICILFDYAMQSEYTKILAIKISLDPIYILVSFSILILVNLIISITFSMVACSSICKKPILETLQDNK